MTKKRFSGTATRRHNVSSASPEGDCREELQQGERVGVYPSASISVNEKFVTSKSPMSVSFNRENDRKGEKGERHEGVD